MRTPLFDNEPYMRGEEEVIGNSRITYVETGPAVSVLPIRRENDGMLYITLVEERGRSDTDQPLLKSPGGYLRGRDRETAAEEILKQKAGITCVCLYALYENMEGFTTIRLPIASYLVLQWTIISVGTAKRVEMLLDDAIEMVLKQEIRDQHNADVIMRLALLDERNRLPL